MVWSIAAETRHASAALPKRSRSRAIKTGPSPGVSVSRNIEKVSESTGTGGIVQNPPVPASTSGLLHALAFRAQGVGLSARLLVERENPHVNLDGLWR